jgi:hypothetical protein
VIAPLTTTIRGWQALHYAEATSATLHRDEGRYAYGVDEPARILTIEDSTARLQRGKSEYRACVATHGERPYRGAGPIEIDWQALHAAALVDDDDERHVAALIVDGHFAEGGCLGYDPGSAL